MREYILSVAAAAVISSVMTMIAPARWSRYVGMITGLLVVICIGRPLFAFVGSDIIGEIDYKLEETEDIANTELIREIEKSVCEQIENDVIARLQSEFGRHCTARAELAIDKEQHITGVGKIVIYGDDIDAFIIGRLRDVYGASEVSYGGIEETVWEQE